MRISASSNHGKTRIDSSCKPRFTFYPINELPRFEICHTRTIRSCHHSMQSHALENSEALGFRSRPSTFQLRQTSLECHLSVRRQLHLIAFHSIQGSIVTFSIRLLHNQQCVQCHEETSFFLNEKLSLLSPYELGGRGFSLWDSARDSAKDKSVARIFSNSHSIVI